MLSPLRNQYTPPLASAASATITPPTNRNRLITAPAYTIDPSMPELPDILLYLHSLRPRIIGHRVAGVRLASPFLLRSIDPPLPSIVGRTLTGLHRLGKRIVIEAED